MFWSAAVLGFLGSLHCVGMCGPIALALPKPAAQTSLQWVGGRILYQAGRIASYATVGLIFGLLGSTLQLIAYQKTLTFVAGGFVLLWGMYHLPAIRQHFRLPSLNPVGSRLIRPISGLMKRRHPGALFALGVMNGFLPCGLVYLAAATSITAGSWSDASLYMMVFGLGTVPAMLTISLSAWKIQGAWRARLNRFLPYAALFLALMMVLRGLELGIPYLSPAFQVLSNGNVAADCH